MLIRGKEKKARSLFGKKGESPFGLFPSKCHHRLPPLPRCIYTLPHHTRFPICFLEKKEKLSICFRIFRNSRGGRKKRKRIAISLARKHFALPLESNPKRIERHFGGGGSIFFSFHPTPFLFCFDWPPPPFLHILSVLPFHCVSYGYFDLQAGFIYTGKEGLEGGG